MSHKEYVDMYESLTKEQRDALWELYMSGTNYDSHVWVTYTDVERMLVKVIEAERSRS